MKKKIWINLDPNREDIQYIVNRLQESGFDAYAKRVEPINGAHAEEARDVDAIVMGTDRWSKEDLTVIKGRIACLMRKGVGCDNIDMQAATEFRIPVMNIPGVNDTAVAEIALCHILNCSRLFVWSMKKMQMKPEPANQFGHELNGAVVGIIGYGKIGKELARLLSVFRAKILVYDAYYTPKVENEQITVAESMEQVFTESDYISLHIPYTSETDKMINKKYFNLMKPTACLINTARGGLVDEDDLYEALCTRRIRAAGLDVVTDEMKRSESPFLQLDNAFVTPHIGGVSIESRDRSAEWTIQSLIDFFDGKNPQNIINKSVLG